MHAGAVGQRHQRPDAGHRHQAAAGLARLGAGGDTAVERGDLGLEVVDGADERLQRGPELRVLERLVGQSRDSERASFGGLSPSACRIDQSALRRSGDWPWSCCQTGGSARSRCASGALTRTGRAVLTRIRSAVPRAPPLVDLVAEPRRRAAAAWLASIKTTGRPKARSPRAHRAEVGPASRPIRSILPSGASAAAASPGALTTER